MDEGIKYRGRWFRAKEIDEIKEIIAAHPDKSRWFLSREICRQWGWTQPNGVLKDIVCRGLLLRLASAGLIQLPPCRLSGQGFGGSSQKPFEPCGISFIPRGIDSITEFRIGGCPPIITSPREISDLP